MAKLLRAFRQLIAAGNSLVVIEHNLDVIAASDWIIDLGPEGGEAGGAVVCTGMPADVRAHATSHTGKALREYEQALAGRPIPTPALPLKGREIEYAPLPSPSRGSRERMGHRSPRSAS